MARAKKTGTTKNDARPYSHPEADSPMRPDVGTQAQFRKKKPPTTYRYDSSLSPALDWDGGITAREAGEALIRQILEAPTLEGAKAAAERLKAVSRPFLNWTGAWENIKRALKGAYEDAVWEHLAGTKSAPFPTGEYGKIAVKVIDDRGNELLVVRELKEAEGLNG